MLDTTTYAAHMDVIECKIRLGNAIRETREREGISQRSLALMIGTSRSYLWEVETGKTSAGIALLCRIADALGVEVKELIDF